LLGEHCEEASINISSLRVQASFLLEHKPDIFLPCLKASAALNHVTMGVMPIKAAEEETGSNLS